MLGKVVSLDPTASDMREEKGSLPILSLTSEVVAAYVSNNSTRSEEISGMILQIYRTLSGLAESGLMCRGNLPVNQPAVPIERSVTQDYIVCLEDGKKLKMLKRHLRTGYNLTPEQYRERWNLPADYPMVAPNYARKRSALAKMNGLGQTFIKRDRVQFGA